MKTIKELERYLDNLNKTYDIPLSRSNGSFASIWYDEAKEELDELKARTKR